MKVYLTSTPEFSTDVLNEVALILGKIPGELEFILGNTMTEQQIQLFNSNLSEIESIDCLSFEDFFGLCGAYRAIREIPQDAFVVLVTSIKNSKNWFSAFNGKNIFIHGIDWVYYTKRDAKFGIAYQILENIFQSLIELNIDDVDNEPNIHMDSIGCINDMCINKKDVMLKLRTADICDSCIDRAIEKEVNPLVLQHIIESIDGLRKEFVNSNRISSTVKPLPVHVNAERSIKIGDKPIEIVALQKVLFIFFLKNLQGVKTQLVYEHQEELIKLYHEIRRSGEKERIIKMFNPEKGADPSFDQHKSKLNKALIKLLGPKLAEYYIISKLEIKDSHKLYKINLEEDYIHIDPIN
jgi:hypothetical protein